MYLHPKVVRKPLLSVVRWDDGAKHPTSILEFLQPILLMPRKDPLLQLLLLTIEAVFNPSAFSA
jgi:hypothetical protein